MLLMANEMRDRLVEMIDDDYFPSSEDLADHLIANGVIVPPCKVGDVVYCIVFMPFGCYWKVEKGFVRKICVTKESADVNIVDCEYTKYANLNITVRPKDFNKTVFLTKEAAEQKLKEMRGE